MAQRRGFVHLEAVDQAFAREQARDEGQVGFAVLHGVAALPALVAVRQVLQGTRAPGPGGVLAVGTEDAVDDLDEGLLLPDGAARAIGQQGQPGAHGELVAGKATVGGHGAGGGDDAAARVFAAAIGQLGQQRHALAQHGVDVQPGVGREGADLQFPGLAQGFALAPALHQQPGRFAFGLQAVEAAVAVEESAKGVLQGVGQRLDHRHVDRWFKVNGLSVWRWRWPAGGPGSWGRLALCPMSLHKCGAGTTGLRWRLCSGRTAPVRQWSGQTERWEGSRPP